ncbi:uncharacterized protein LOC135699279 isoform X3 [Ochlerotatus camptorhynchus]|uniref:uncharacterized protein LOC135699279 isoform X3 n=1 Tax=Ochlerotatus camptorhynchus TaxID=644619 RepID=UPI0031E3DDDB
MATVNSRIEPTGGSFGPRKTLIIMVTVVGCIAILWPKVFYPMMVGPTQTKSVVKDHRGSGCCDVVLDQEETFANMSINIPSQQNLFRKRNIGPTVEDSSIRQERPPHLRPDTIHPAMRERGRAIPHVGSVHSERPQSSPRIVEGRPGPIPGMRPPMGAGSHQSTKSANSMGFIMPLYTIGIVSFFIYTILKLIFKKTPVTPYPEIKPDTTFRNEVFTTPDPYIKRPDIGTTKLGQPIANGENGAPVSVGPVSNGSASTNFSHSVQAEISVDYQLLAAKPEPSPATTDSSVEDEPFLVTAAPVEQGKSGDASSAPEETNNDECVQPEYDPATEKVVDGIVEQKVVRLDEEGTSNEIIEQVASQVVEEVLQEAESKINEAAEAAAVELVDKVVEQAETASLVADIDESAEKGEPITSAEESIVLNALSEAVGEQVSATQEEVVCEASVPEVVDEVEPILISKEVTFAEAAHEVVSEVTEPSEKPQEDKIQSTETESIQEETAVELTVSEAATTDEVIQVSEEAIVTDDVFETASKVEESNEKPQDKEGEPIEAEVTQEEIVIKLFASEAEQSIQDSEEATFVVEDTVEQDVVEPMESKVTQEESTEVTQEEIVIKLFASEAEQSIQDSEEAAVVVEDKEEQSEQDVVEPMESKVTQEESTVEEPVSEAVIVAEPILALADEVVPKVEDVAETSQEELVEPTESQVVQEEPTVEIAVSDEATVEDVLQALKEVTFADEEQVKKSLDGVEEASEQAAAQIEACEVLSESRVTFVDEVVEIVSPVYESIEKDTPIEAETTSEATIIAEEPVESSRGVTFEDEIVEIVSKVDELVEILPEVVDEPSELTVVTSTVDVVVDNSTSTDAELSIDDEEATIKALAANMEEAIAQQSEEAEARAVAEELVNEVLEQAESIANETAEVDSFELPSFDPATQKLVDGEVINRFAPEDVLPQIAGESSSVAEPAIEEVVEKVSVQEVSAFNTEKLPMESPVEIEEAVSEVNVDGEDSGKASDEVEKEITQTEAFKKEIVQEITVQSVETEEKAPAIEEPAEKVDADELSKNYVDEIKESSSEPEFVEETIITEKVETMVEPAQIETSHEQNELEAVTIESNLTAESEQPKEASHEVASCVEDNELDREQPVEEDVIVAEITESTEAVCEAVQESVVKPSPVESTTASDAVEESIKFSEPTQTIEGSVSVPTVNEEPLTSENAVNDGTNVQLDSVVEEITSVISKVIDPVQEIITVTETTADATSINESSEEVSTTVTDSEALPEISETVFEVQSGDTEAASVVEESVSANEPSTEEQITVEEETVVESNHVVEDNSSVLETPVAVTSVDETKLVEISVEQQVEVNETSESVTAHSVEHEVPLSATPGKIRKEEPALESATSVQVDAVSSDIQKEINVVEVTDPVEESPSVETETKEAAQTSESVVAEIVEEEDAFEKEADSFEIVKQVQDAVETESENVTETTADETKDTPLMDVADIISVEVKVTDGEQSVEPAVEEIVMKEVATVQESEPIDEVKKEQVAIETEGQTETEMTSTEMQETTLTEVEVKDLAQASESAVDESVKEEVPAVQEAEPIEIVQEEQVTVETEEQKVSETTTTEAKETPLTDIVEAISVDVEGLVQNSEEQVAAERIFTEKPAEQTTVPPAPDVVSETIITTEVLHGASSTEPVILSCEEATVEVVSVNEVSVEEPEESSSKLLEDSFTRGPTIEEIHDETVDASDEGKTSDEFPIKVEVEKVDTSEMISEVTDEPTVTSSVPSVTTAPVLDIISENQEDAELAEIEKDAAEAKLIEQVRRASQDYYTKEHEAKEALVERTLTEATAVATEIEQIVDHIITEKISHVIPPEVCSQDVAEDQTASEVVSEPEKLASSAAKVVESIISEEKVSATSSVTSTVPASSSCPAEANNSINQLSTSTDTNQPECPSTQSSSTTLPSSSPAVDPISSKNEQEDDSIVRDAPISNLNFAVVEGIQDAAQHAASSAEHVISSSISCTTTTTITSLTQHPEAISSSSSSSSAAIIDQVPTSVSNVTNPKFLTLNLVNYSPSGSSGNNSNSSASALTQSRNAAGTADVAAVASDSSDQLMELDLLRRKLDETELAMAKIIANMGAIPKGQETEETDNTEIAEKLTEQNGHVCKPVDDSSKTVVSEMQKQDEQLEREELLQQQEQMEQKEQQPEAEEDAPMVKQQHLTGAVPKKREVSEDRSLLKVIPMEKRAAYEPGQHSSRPGTPVQHVTLDQSLIEADGAESKCILLDANVPQKVSVADSELAVETLEASQKRSEETPVVLSGMMKLSLVKLDDSVNKPAGDVVLKAKDVKKGDTFGAFGPNEE